MHLYGWIYNTFIQKIVTLEFSIFYESCKDLIGIELTITAETFLFILLVESHNHVTHYPDVE